MKNYIVALIVLAAICAGALLGGTIRFASEETDYLYTTPPLDGFSQVDVEINGTTVRLFDECYVVSFDVTEDQAYSIERGSQNTIGPRPLTHDIMKDMLDNFGITLDQARIDRYEDEIYEATLYMRRANTALQIDARPSDAIALSMRLDTPIYFDTRILHSMGRNECVDMS